MDLKSEEDTVNTELKVEEGSVKNVDEQIELANVYASTEEDQVDGYQIVTTEDSPPGDDGNDDVESPSKSTKSRKSIRVQAQALTGKVEEIRSSNPYVIRLYHIVISTMEIADLVSDFTWFITITTIIAYSVITDDDQPRTSESKNDDDYWGSSAIPVTDDQFTFFLVLFYFTLFFLIVSTLLIFYKVVDDFNGMTKVDPETKKIPREHCKLHIFGVSFFYLFTLPNSKVLELSQQAAKDEEMVKTHLLDALLGLHRKNYIEKELPGTATIMIGNINNDAGDRIVKACDIVSFPFKVLHSPKLVCRAFGPYMIVLWPLYYFIGIYNYFMWYLFVGFFNILLCSHHAFTIRILEDLPQMVINIVYITSRYAFEKSNTSSFSIACSSILLAKALFDMGRLAYSSRTNSKALQKKKWELTDDITAYQLQRAMFTCTCLMPLFTMWYIFQVFFTAFYRLGKAILRLLWGLVGFITCRQVVADDSEDNAKEQDTKEQDTKSNDDNELGCVIHDPEETTM